VKTVIVGCGRVGAVLASSFDQAGHEVIILDLTSRAFDRLPSAFKGTALRGDGTDEDLTLIHITDPTRLQLISFAL
jgi:trk system potassium uptake protein TrkA